MFSVSDNNSTLPVVALAGNPNVGKSTIFNTLTGLRQHTGNWSGKTVSLACGKVSFNKFSASDHNQDMFFTLVDLPGCYSLNPCSEEEKVARDFLVTHDPVCVVVVLDATCLRRSLALALQVFEITSNIIIAVNLIDEAEKNGIRINTELLSGRLGVPVIPCSAKRGIGLDLLLKTVKAATHNPICNADISREISETRTKLEAKGISPSAVQEDLAVYYGKLCTKLSDGIVLDASDSDSDHSDNTDHTDYPTCHVCLKTRKRSSTGGLIDRIVTGKYTAFPIMFLLLMGIFYITIVGANYPSELISVAFNKLETLLRDLFAGINAPQFITEPILTGVFRTLGRVIAVMLPPMAIFFPLFTLAEDLGYLPRVAFNLDRCFKCCNACGKQALTMCMGFGCNAVGVTGCRIISSPRERLIAILTNSFIPCNGRFPMLIAVISMFIAGIGAASGLIAASALAAAVVFAVGVTLAISKLLGETLLKGEVSSFTLELPPYRAPRVGQVILRSILDRTLHVLGRAVIVAAPAGLIIYILANVYANGISLLSLCCNFLDPFARLIGLDGVILASFILAFPANELVIPIMLMAYTAAGSFVELSTFGAMHELLLLNGWTIKTAICFILFALLHWPCSTTVLTIRKETGGWKWAGMGILIPTLCGIVLCAIVNLVL